MVASKTKQVLPKDAAQNKRFGIVVSRYHEDICNELLKGATDTLTGLGAKADDIKTVWVPGAFEIPLAARALAPHEFDALICLGLILKGETRHDEYIAQSVAPALAQLAQVSGIPVIFGVLTTQTLEQAKERCGGSKGHKGVEAAEAAVSMVRVLEDIKKTAPKRSKAMGFGNP